MTTNLDKYISGDGNNDLDTVLDRMKDDGKDVMVYIVFHANDNVHSVYSGKGTAERVARQIGGYITALELDPHMTPFALQ